LIGHKDVVLALDVSEHFIATGGKDQSIRVWDRALLTELCALEGHAASVTCLCFLGQDLVSGSEDKTLKRWDLSPLRSKKKKAEKVACTASHTWVAHAKGVNDVASAPKGRMLASGGQDKMVHLWSPTGELLGTCKGHKRGIWHCAFSPVERIVASAGGDGTIKLWNLKDYACVRTLQGHEGPVLRLSFCTAGMQILSCGADGLVKLWVLRTGECVVSYDKHNDKVWCLELNEDGRLATGGSDGQIIFWSDCTAEMDREEHEEQARKVVQTAQIDLLLTSGKVAQALTSCLELDRPAAMRRILTDLSEEAVLTAMGDAPRDGQHFDLDVWVRGLNSAAQEKLVQVLAAWITNAKSAGLAAHISQSLLRCVPALELSRIEGFNLLVQAFLSYAPRHNARLEGLLQQSYVLDFVLKHGAAQHLQADMRDILNHGSSGDVTMEDSEPVARRKARDEHGRFVFKRGRAALRRFAVVPTVTKHAPASKKAAKMNGK